MRNLSLYLLFPICIGLNATVSQAAQSNRWANGSGPDPFCGNVPRAITITPDGSAPFKVVVAFWIQGFCQRRANALVEIYFGPGVRELLSLPPDQSVPIIGYTDPNGEVTFYIRGGGCVDFNRFHPPYPYSPIAQVMADGIVLEEPMINSPDAVDRSGSLPTESDTNTCEDGVTEVGLADGVFHSRAIKRGLVEPCSKFIGPPTEPVGILDATFVTTYIKQGIHGFCQ
jgi:hypothetical protein